jgi:hypothetical protein
VAKRKVTYPVAKTANRPARPTGAGPETRPDRPTVATIDVNAGIGRPGLSIGSRVRISGTGLYGGELAVIERFATGVIPSAVVRTDNGKTRQVRTIDLEPVAPGTTSSTTAAAGPAPAAAPAPAAPTPAAPVGPPAAVAAPAPAASATPPAPAASTGSAAPAPAPAPAAKAATPPKG